MLRKRNISLIIGFLCLQCLCAFAEPENGVQREFYPNGKVRLESVFKKGRVVRSRTFYENGRLQSEFCYTPGALQRSRTFYSNGVLRSEWSRKAGTLRLYNMMGVLTNEAQIKDY